MNVKNKNIQWIVQANLTSQDDLAGLRNGCKNNNISFIEVKVIPFSTELPDFEILPCSIYYGSTTFNNLIYENEITRQGLFFNPETFSIENYIDKWGKYMLNYGASITTFKELMSSKYESQKLLFIRPNDDSKSFAGEVKRFVEIGDWYEKLKNISNINLSLESKIIVSEPYNLKSEWRLWIVNKKVVTASKYRDYFKLSKERGCPPEVILFAEKRCQEYTPHDVFVMDICLNGDDYYIIECGCMNGAGFYKGDIDKIVKSVTEYFREVCCP
jgi:ATP-grasp domain, R2K clade family 3